MASRADEDSTEVPEGFTIFCYINGKQVEGKV